ncbi:MAG: cysteine--tRNA ligase, partial [Bacteroidales bacterium]|nr:cysteine--tRNA ligase [Bacteroidales bacterium]
TLSESDLQQLQKVYHQFAWDVLGLKEEKTGSDKMALIGGLIDYILDQRMQAKARKDFAASDQIRDMLKGLGVEVKDRKDGFDWKLEN